MNPLDREIIDETAKKFAGDPEVANRILWWLQDGYSCERWFQFEWAYKLESVLKCQYQDTYLVGCERDRIDIVIYQQPFDLKHPLREQKHFSGIELKWCGNWAVNDRKGSIAETRKDFKNVRKDKKYNCPVLSLSVWLFVTPSENSGPFYSWIDKQIKAEKVDQQTLMQNLVSFEPDIKTGPYEIECPSDFGTLEIFCIGVYNDKAKSQMIACQ